MDNHIAESVYPLSFRQEESEKLGKYLQQRRSVNLIGMRRVGISNFLRFFLYHKNTVKTYISSTQKHLFIPVDLNDLVEREIYPFWTLTLKRIVDSCETSALSEETKQKISNLFLTVIQSQDLFLVIDTIRKALIILVENGINPTLFFLRFDRLQDAFNPSFFDNLEGLYDAAHHHLAYVFTSYRSLDSIFPSTKTTLSVFAQQMYVKPADEKDMESIYDSFQERYSLSLSKELERALFKFVAGNVQYLHLALILLNEKKNPTAGSGQVDTGEKLFKALTADERIMLESEELWESLAQDEKKVLLQVVNKRPLTRDEELKAEYLLETGFIVRGKVFSPLFEHYLLHKSPEEKDKKEAIHLTRKEHMLFKLLEAHIGDICEREEIIEKVWPEYKEFGVSDWAIDRLVARVRVKLREQKSPYEIVTVRTRGYKLATLKG